MFHMLKCVHILHKKKNFWKAKQYPCKDFKTNSAGNDTIWLDDSLRDWLFTSSVTHNVFYLILFWALHLCVFMWQSDLYDITGMCLLFLNFTEHWCNSLGVGPHWFLEFCHTSLHMKAISLYIYTMHRLKKDSNRGRVSFVKQSCKKWCKAFLIALDSLTNC